MTNCDWCGIHNRPAYEISFGGDILHICGICYMGIQDAVFGEDCRCDRGIAGRNQEIIRD